MGYSTGLTQFIRLHPKPKFKRLKSNHEKVTDSLKQSGAYQYKDLVFTTSGKGVYRPTSESSSLFVLKNLPKFTAKSVAEIGTGCGIIAIALAKTGNQVTASDISRRSVEVARNNAKFNSVKLTLLKSDLFEMYNPEQKFDRIVFNSPFMDKPLDCDEELALCDPNATLVKSFLAQATKHLESDGRIYLATANIANLRGIKAAMKNLNLTGSILAKEHDAGTGMVRFLMSIWVSR